MKDIESVEVEGDSYLVTGMLVGLAIDFMVGIVIVSEMSFGAPGLGPGL